MKARDKGGREKQKGEERKARTRITIKGKGKYKGKCEGQEGNTKGRDRV